MVKIQCVINVATVAQMKQKNMAVDLIEGTNC